MYVLNYLKVGLFLCMFSGFFGWFQINAIGHLVWSSSLFHLSTAKVREAMDIPQLWKCPIYHMKIASCSSGLSIFKYSNATVGAYLHVDSKGDSNSRSPIIWGCDLFWGTHPRMMAALLHNWAIPPWAACKPGLNLHYSFLQPNVYCQMSHTGSWLNCYDIMALIGTGDTIIYHGYCI